MSVHKTMPDFPALLLKSRTCRSLLLPGRAQNNTIIALLSADVGPWLAALRGEGVRRWSCHPIAATPGTSAAIRWQQNSPPTPSCSLEKPLSFLAPGASSTLDFLVAEPASDGADVLYPSCRTSMCFPFPRPYFTHPSLLTRLMFKVLHS